MRGHTSPASVTWTFTYAAATNETATRTEKQKSVHVSEPAGLGGNTKTFGCRDKIQNKDWIHERKQKKWPVSCLCSSLHLQCINQSATAIFSKVGCLYIVLPNILLFLERLFLPWPRQKCLSADTLAFEGHEGCQSNASGWNSLERRQTQTWPLTAVRLIST